MKSLPYLPSQQNTDKTIISFGFRDGLSQPLLEGIDRKDNFDNSPAMKTPQKIITVTDDPPPAQEGYQKLDPKQRPKWMIDGSFLVFRKLEQDVKKYDELTKQFEAAHCTSPDQFGAKLMGRWKSGMDRNAFSVASSNQLMRFRQVALSRCLQITTPMTKNLPTTSNSNSRRETFAR